MPDTEFKILLLIILIGLAIALHRIWVLTTYIRNYCPVGT